MYSSFGLMNSSFDTLSDAGRAFDGDDAILSPVARGTSHVRLHRTESLPASAVHLAPRDLEASDGSIGDISPIKVVYMDHPDPRSASLMQEAFGDPMTTRFVRQAQHPTSVIPVDWMQDDTDHYNLRASRSNPIYVLRSSRKAFDKVKYLLPCLSSTTGQCSVHLSDRGNIRQYKDEQVGWADPSFDSTNSLFSCASVVCDSTLIDSRIAEQNRLI
jgi:hypothetical protein